MTKLNMLWITSISIYLISCGIEMIGAFILPTPALSGRKTTKTLKAEKTRAANMLNNQKNRVFENHNRYVDAEVYNSLRKWCVGEKTAIGHRLMLELSSSNDVEFDMIEADDGEALQKLFLTRCDSEGLMTKEETMEIPSIAQLLEDKDLLPEEFDEIWDAAPKFPEVEIQNELDIDSSFEPQERIDVDSFIQVYRDIDDLFEDFADEKEGDQQDDIPQTPLKENTPSIDQELKISFDKLCPSNSTDSISKQNLRAWGEIEELITDGMLTEEEFNMLWDKAIKSKKNNKNNSDTEIMEIDTFVSFNNALDDLFETEDEKEDPQQQNQINKSNSASNRKQMVVGDDLSPQEIFSQLADENQHIKINDLQRWPELLSMINNGDLLLEELKDLFQSQTKAPGTTDALDQAGFIALYNAIDALFEDYYDDEDQLNNQDNNKSIKDELIQKLENIQDNNDFEQSLPCGLDTTERQQAEILQIVTALETEPQNICLNKKIQMEDLAGSWDLLYTSSSMMRFNKGLTGLGGSFPNGKFAGLRQNLILNKYITDVEYTERIAVNPEQNSFDVKVNGDWELKSSVSLFTGAPSTILSIEPDKVVYGPTTTRADHWKSVRSMNLLDLSYLDNDLRIMRGNTSTDTLFIFKRCVV